MSRRQYGKGYHEGASVGMATGIDRGMDVGAYQLAEKMRVMMRCLRYVDEDSPDKCILIDIVELILKEHLPIDEHSSSEVSHG